MQQRNAFTLIEVILSLTVLIAGMTAAFSVILLGTTWATNSKIANIGYDTGFTVLENARVLDADPNVSPANPDNDDEIVKGWLNTFFIVREIDTSKTIDFGNGVKSRTITVRVYHGGTDQDGNLVAQITGKVIDK